MHKYGCVTILLLMLSIVMSANLITAGSDDGLLIVVTFSNLKYDIEPLLCEGDEIAYIAPPGVDPHEYQLKPNDVDLLRKADLIISTAHAPFELKIKERSDINATIIEIPFIDNITLLTNPMTGNYNYHMPIYDPRNYIVFINYVAKKLAQLRPACRTHYLVNAARITGRVMELMEFVKTYGNKTLSAVGDKPFVQYGVSWLGIDIKYLLIREHEAPVTARDYENVLSMISNREVDLVVVSSPPVDQSSRYLIDLADKYNIPVLYVPVPFSQSGFLEKLENISNQYVKIRVLSSLNTEQQCEAIVVRENTMVFEPRIALALTIIAVSVVISLLYYKTKKRWFEWLRE